MDASTITQSSLLALNIAACAVLFTHGVCRVSTGQWRLTHPMLAVYVMLIGGGLGGLLGPFYGGHAPQASEVMINVSGALYVLAMWRMARREGDLRRRDD